MHVIFGVAAVSTVIFIAAGLDILSQQSGLLFIAFYTLMACLFLTGRLKVLIAGFAILSTVIIFVFIGISADLNIISGPPGLMLLIMWSCVMLLLMEFAFVSGHKSIEKIDFYRKYIYLNMLQLFMIMASMSLLLFGPRIRSGTASEQSVVQDIVTILMILFGVSLALFLIFVFRNLTSGKFFADFAQSLAGLQSGLEEKEKGKKPAEIDFLKVFKRMRFISYILFIFSLAGIYLVARYRLLDSYVDVISGRNPAVASIIHAVKGFYLAPGLDFFARIFFFIIDLLILKEIVEFIGKERVAKLFNKALYKLGIEPPLLKKGEITPEHRLITGLVQFHCNTVHHTAVEQVCPECRGIIDYAYERLSACAYLGMNRYDKPPCSACPKDCYSPEMRAKVKEIFKYR